VVFFIIVYIDPVFTVLSSIDTVRARDKE